MICGTNEKIQVLVATMHQQDFSKVEQMKINTDVLFANQSDRTEYMQKSYGHFKAEMISTQTRGVGINRNLALSYATGDILLLADDDLEYYPEYESMIRKAFADRPEADAFVFNIDRTDGQAEGRHNTKIKRVRIINGLNYGTVRIAVRRQSITRERIMFSSCFGGGTQFSCGEDSLFICDMLRKGLRVYTSPDTIAAVDMSKSSWFSGYHDKFFYDKGVLYRALFPKGAMLMCLQYLIRHPYLCREAGITLAQAMKKMRRGAKAYPKLKPWVESPAQEVRA